MNEHWKRIYSSPLAFQVELLHRMLEHHNIPAVVINKQDAMYKIGEVELYTRREYVVRALNLIKKTEQ